MSEQKDIKIPIKEIVQTSAMKHELKIIGNCFTDDEIYDETFIYFRRYFIACLNLGYFKPTDLIEMNCKFFSKIHKIQYLDSNIEKVHPSNKEIISFFKDGYFFRDDGLYILDNSSYDQIAEKRNEDKYLLKLPDYDIAFFKAISEVMLGSSKKEGHPALHDCLSEIAAEKIFEMDLTGSRIIMPKTAVV